MAKEIYKEGVCGIPLKKALKDLRDLRNINNWLEVKERVILLINQCLGWIGKDTTHCIDEQQAKELREDLIASAEKLGFLSRLIRGISIRGEARKILDTVTDHADVECSHCFTDSFRCENRDSEWPIEKVRERLFDGKGDGRS